MRRTEVYQVRLDVHEKKQAFAVFKQLGISPAQAIRLFFRQVVVTRSIPFPIEHGVSALDQDVAQGSKSLKKIAAAPQAQQMDIDDLASVDLKNMSDQDVFDQLDELLKDNS